VVGEVGLAPGSATWVDRPPDDGAPVLAQVSAHGRPLPATYRASSAAPDDGAGSRAHGPLVRFDGPQRPVAPGQTVALYDPAEPDAVLGAGIAT
jgi:tRNA-specific 2-thiouridylase